LVPLISLRIFSRNPVQNYAIRTRPFAAFGHSHAPTATAVSMPTSCAAMNANTPLGAIPAKVSDNERAIVTAGFANDVEAVNQYAAVM
jgi:hypothetical protein